MSEYWKSTPSYWCKFCSQYVRDTGLERKNHEASARHQNNIQRSLRQLHKDKQIEERDKQRAKDEVARLNGLFEPGSRPSSTTAPAAPTTKATTTAPPSLNTAAQRKAHAEQLAALGVELPDELKKEVTGLSSYQVVNERAVSYSTEGGSISVNRSLAEILAESKKQAELKDEEVKTEEEIASTAKGVYKRKAEDEEEDERDEEATPRRKAWGSHLKQYPGTQNTDDDADDLDALLSGVKRKKEADLKSETLDEEAVKEEGDEEAKPIDQVPGISEAETAGVKEGSRTTTTPTVVFKKRKVKK